MKKHTYIYIQEPCHENWSNMTTEEQGRFCHSCSKTVTDFSVMTDTEILKHLSAAKGSTCGRFATDQITREIHQPATAAKKTFWAYLLSMFLPVMVAGKLNAQKKEEKPKTEQHLNNKPAKQLKEMKILECADTSDTAKLSNTGTETNGEKLEGNFKTKPVMMGLIIEYDKVKKTDTISTIISKATKNEMFSIYPNPALKGKKASIKMNTTGEFAIQLLDLESKMIVYKTIDVVTKGQEIFLEIPREIASGTYYLRLVQAGSNKQFVDKLMVK